MLTIALGVAGGIVLALGVVWFVGATLSGAINVSGLGHALFRWLITLMLTGAALVVAFGEGFGAVRWVALVLFLGAYVLHGWLKRGEASRAVPLGLVALRNRRDPEPVGEHRGGPGSTAWNSSGTVTPRPCAMRWMIRRVGFARPRSNVPM